MEHWNGTAWSVVPSPSPGTDGNYLNGVAAVSANDVWAVGYYASVAGMPDADRALERHSWVSGPPSPNPGTGTNGILNGVAAVSANDVWAVGFTNGTVPDAGGALERHSMVGRPSPNPGTESTTTCRG